jgi:hypothetical protein
MSSGPGSLSTGRVGSRRGWTYELARRTPGDRLERHPFRLPRRAHRAAAAGAGGDRLCVDARSGRRGRGHPDHHGTLVDSSTAAQAHVGHLPRGAARRRGRCDAGGPSGCGGRAVVPGGDGRFRARGGAAQRRVGPARLGAARRARRSIRRRARGVQVARRAGHRGTAGDDTRPAGDAAVDRTRWQCRHGRTRGDPVTGGCAPGGNGAAERAQRRRGGRPATAGPALPPSGDPCRLAGAGGGLCGVVRVSVGLVRPRRRAGARRAAGDGWPDGVRRGLPRRLGVRRGRGPVSTAIAPQCRCLGGRRVGLADDGRPPDPVRDRCSRSRHGSGSAGRQRRHHLPGHPVDVRPRAPFRVDSAGHRRGRGLDLGQLGRRSADRHVRRPGGHRWRRGHGPGRGDRGRRSSLGATARAALSPADLAVG